MKIVNKQYYKSTFQIGLAQAPALDYFLAFNDYENNGSVTAKVYPDGTEGGVLGDMIAAFVDDEQRGVGGFRWRWCT